LPGWISIHDRRWLSRQTTVLGNMQAMLPRLWNCRSLLRWSRRSVPILGMSLCIPQRCTLPTTRSSAMSWKVAASPDQFNHPQWNSCVIPRYYDACWKQNKKNKLAEQLFLFFSKLFSCTTRMERNQGRISRDRTHS
jgi:hypothetical protein